MSKIVIGTVQFGIEYGINNLKIIPEDDAVREILQYANENNIKILDTAIGYGRSEQRLGYLMETEFEIISKFSKLNNKEDLRKALNATLKKLKIAKLYGFLFHDANELIKNPLLWNFLEDLKKESKIKKLGYSIYNTGQLDQLIEFGFIPDIVQLPYSLLDRQFENYFKKLKQYNVEIHIRSVFLQGLYFKALDKFPENLFSLKKEIKILNELCVDNDVTMTSLALNFVKQNPFIDYIVLGVISKKQLVENLISLNQELSEKIMKSIKKIDVKNKKLLNPNNWN